MRDLTLKLRIISTDEIRQILQYEACIDVVRDAMIETSRRNVQLPLRHGMPLKNGNGLFGLMYGSMGEPCCFGIKLVSIFPRNTQLGLSSHMGLLVLYEAERGCPVAVMEAGIVTAIRTAAATAVATAALAREDSAVLTILGTGEQAQAHLDALLLVRPIKRVNVWGRSAESVERFVGHNSGKEDIEIIPVASAESAARDADIICTVTSAGDPVLSGCWIKEGTHLNLVGSSFPDKAEVDTEAVKRSRYFVDFIDSTLAQAGEFLKAKAEGVVDDSHIVAEIGQVLAGESKGRRTAEEITCYKSLGIISQDLAAATYVLQQAEAENRGVEVSL